MDDNEGWPVEADEARKSVCKTFFAKVTSFHFRTTPDEQPTTSDEQPTTSDEQPTTSDQRLPGGLDWTGTIWDLIYCRDTFCEDVKLVTHKNGWNWIHLETHNIIWIKDLVKILLIKGIIADPENMVFRHVDDSYRDKFLNYGPENGFGNLDEVLSFNVPYFDSESDRYISCDNTERTKQQSALEAAYGVRFDRSRPLDLSFVKVPVDSEVEELLAKDQVVYRHTSRLHNKNPVKILMVNSLRLWMFGKTVITSHQSRWTDKSPTLVDNIRNLVLTLEPEDNSKPPAKCPSHPPTTRRALKSHSDFVGVIDFVQFLLLQCIEALEDPYKAGLQCNLVDIFSSEIIAQAVEQLRSFKAFTKALREPNEVERGKTIRRLISEEIQIYRKIMDIRDELSLIQQVWREQKEIAVGLFITDSGVDSIVYRNFTLNSPLNTALSKWAGRFDDLDRRADRVEKSLKHSVDLKLKQSSLDEARDANTQAREARKQSNTLFAFTIITVLFSPLSFVASFFAIPTQSFPFDDSRNVVNWSRNQIGIGLVVGVLIVALPCYLIWAWAARENPDPPPLSPLRLKVDKDDIWGDQNAWEPKEKKKAVASGALT